MYEWHKVVLLFKDWIFRFFWLVPLCSLALLVLVFLDRSSSPFWFTFIGGSFAFAYFTQQQKLQETHLFRQAFESFNSRYDSLNEDLNLICRLDNISAELEPRLIDYFNLCAEEYLLYRRGYIPQNVWESWVRGMSRYWSASCIQETWKRELKESSYYGFAPSIEIEKLKS